MKSFLNSQLLFPGSRSIVSETLFLAAYVLFVLFIFQPFGTYEYRHPYKISQLGGYGLVVILCYPLIKKSLLLFFKGEVYFLKHEALILSVTFLILIVIGFFYYAWAISGTAAWRFWPAFTITGILFMLLPYSAMVYNSWAKAQKNKAGEPAENTLEIKGTNLYEHFRFNAADVLYLKSNGNYVLVYFLKNGAIHHEMVRNTLNQVSAQLAGTDFTAIHRSFLVNTKNFNKLIRENGKHILLNQQFDIACRFHGLICRPSKKS